MTPLSSSSLRRLLLGSALGVLTLAAGAQTKPSANAAQRPVDWFTLLESFALPADASYTVNSWDVNATARGPIRWQTDGIAPTPEGYERKGTAVVTVDGKPLEVLGRTRAPHAWSLTLLGPRAGVEQVRLSSAIIHQALTLDVAQALAKRGVPHRLVKCDEIGAATFGARLYEVRPAGRKPFQLLHEHSCGSGGCSADLAMFLTPPNLATASLHKLVDCKP